MKALHPELAQWFGILFLNLNRLFSLGVPVFFFFMAACHQIDQVAGSLTPWRTRPSFLGQKYSLLGLQLFYCAFYDLIVLLHSLS